MSPILSWIMCFVFFLLSLVYRHQLYYIYPTTNDTGGYIFPQFVRMVIVCIYIAQMTLIGVLGLKKQGLASSLCIPLLIGTVFFNTYINQQHYHMTKNMPSTMSVKEDGKNFGAIDFIDLVGGRYLQPSMQNLITEPDNMSKES